ncbi:MAG: AMP-binding protein [Paludibacteraceae bacterium]|nr:AMP-binding protein [Paludibacteraceae bacterium]
MTRNYLDILAETIRNNWDAPALTDFYLTEDGSAQDTSRGNHYTYGEMYAEICRVAELLASLGLQKGDHVAICGANSAHWVIAYLAIAKMQGVSVTVMHTLMPDEIARLIDFSDAKALFTDEDIWTELDPLYRPSLGDLSAVISLADWSILRGEKNTNYKLQITNGEIGFSPVEPDSLAMICFTSGTSGTPKGVIHTYNNLSANIEGAAKLYPSIKNKRTLVFFPLSHILSLGTILGSLLTKCHIFIMRSIMTPEALATSVLHVRPYILPVVPKVAQYLLSEEYQNVCNIVKEFLEYLVIAGAMITKDEASCIMQQRIPLTAGYGLTEAPILSSILPCRYRENSVGKIVSGMTCRISPEGEILVKGENVMLGYYKDPEATAAKIDSDDWLHTGDKGHLDEDGYLYVEGRLEQDIIVLPNGENIRPDNIESLINALPEVKESIVLARDGKLMAIVVPSSLPFREESEVGSLRRIILRNVNPSLPLFSQLYDVEITDTPLQRTEKQTIKRYLYK